MSHNNNEKFILFLLTLSSLGVIVVNAVMGWEFWVPAVILVGVALIWIINLSDRLENDIRQIVYFISAVLLIFYYGIHKTSLFDSALVVALVMVSYSVFNRIFMMNVLLLEFFLILLIHLLNLPGGDPLVFEKLSISRIMLHITIVLFVYFISTGFINDRLEDEEESRIKEGRIEANDASMEDFLSNISHELRTPVNVVNGMSDLLIKRGVGPEADSIKSAGVRLAYQIEDIQDYTECKRRKVFLEEDSYMSTSLINDVVTAFRMSDKTGDLELVVDMNPLVPAMMVGDIKKLHKIFRHLLENAIKFTRKGGILVKVDTEDTDYGVNLCIEMRDTGIGMDRGAIRAVTEGLYQENKKRNRSSGGIGLGLFIVYGFAHRMGGFVKIESNKKSGTVVRVTVPQKVVDAKPCLALEDSFDGAILFHVRPDKYKIPQLRDFYRSMASNLATGIHVPLYSAETVYEVERLKEKTRVTHIFMGQEEYEENRGYFEELAKEDILLAVSADPGFETPPGSRIMVIPKPVYAYPIIRILNRRYDPVTAESAKDSAAPVFKNVKALVVDDEPMNLIVATSLFRDYEMIIDTAGSGKEAIRKFRESDLDLIFMDHMMPEMDGVEAMKQIKKEASDSGRSIRIVALTANAVSGAREMFMKEGFDGFIAKPIDRADFERVMLRVLHGDLTGGGGERR